MSHRGLALAIGLHLLELLLSAQPLSPRKVSYDIRARLDSTTKILEGEETITYRHEDEEEDLTSLQFHLYWNAFQDSRSSFQRELALASGASRFDEKRAGRMDITAVWLGENRIPDSAIRYIHPDDTNADDRTVAEVALPEPVTAGSEISVRVAFRARFPEMAPRAGYGHDLFMAGQWFPKLGVWQRGMWVTHQYHAWAEFFADFGTYTVTLTLPRAFVVAASGDLLSESVQGGRKTVAYRAEDVHDFSWAAWPRFRRLETRWRNVRLELYYAPEHRDARRHLEAAQAALEWLDRRLGPYPYPALVIVDVPTWAGEFAGMEYPRLVTTTMPWLAPRAWRLPELITIHEVGHQYFYGMLANDEAREAWLDEGINTFVEAAIADSLYGPGRSWLALRGLDAGDSAYWRGAFAPAPALDPVVKPAWQYWSARTYGAATYAKTLYLLRTAEELVGPDTFWKAMRSYFERWRFRHPTTKDFLDTFREATGQDLDWFFRQALFQPSTLDYAVSEARREQLAGNRFFHHLRVRRLGDMTMPVEASVHFENSTVQRAYWDGRSRWHDFTFEASSDLAWAEITSRPLEVNRVDNSYSRKPSFGAAVKLAGLWAFFLQHLLELAAWLV